MKGFNYHRGGVGPRMMGSSVFGLAILAVLLLLGIFGGGFNGVGESVRAQGIVLPSLNQPQKVTYLKLNLPQGVAHIIHVPVGANMAVVPAVHPAVAEVGAYATLYPKAFAILNGGYFDPNNQKTTSYVKTPWGTFLNPMDNEKLMGNAKLVPYMDKILNRSELRMLYCGSGLRYDIHRHQDPVLPQYPLVGVLGAGPQLYPVNTQWEEAFVDGPAGAYIRDPLGVDAQNARSGVGLSKSGDIWLVMLAQGDFKQEEANPTGINPRDQVHRQVGHGQANRQVGHGMTLAAFGQFIHGLGADTVLALDGGTSSSLWVNGKTVIGKRNPQGEPITRKVKSVLMVVPVETVQEAYSAGHVTGRKKP